MFGGSCIGCCLQALLHRHSWATCNNMTREHTFALPALTVPAAHCVFEKYSMGLPMAGRGSCSPRPHLW
jgi:hypothetical protein